MRINTNVFGRGAVLDFELYNLFMPSGLLYFNPSDQFTSNNRGIWLAYIIITIFIAIPVLNAKDVEPDQTPYVYFYHICICTCQV